MKKRMAALLLLAALCAVLSLPADGSGAGHVLVIDPGHGGEDGGAVAADGTVESGVNLSTALRLSRFALAVAAALAGLYGIVMVTAFLLWHLCSIESFGRAYVSTPPAGHSEPGAASIFFRKPPWRDTIRDGDINGGDLRRRT